MNEPKTPNNSRDWESIDIFLFSNGQQYSPPRKYHLQADDLNWWDATKNFLARSQFGSMHSTMELYTLDGKKVEGPLELENSAAYVAVEPPDSFISAGYEKYLIKASRSWEKRQEKLSNKEDKTNEGDTEMYLDVATLKQLQGIIAFNTIAEKSSADPVKLTASNNTEDKMVSKIHPTSADKKQYFKNKTNSANCVKNVMKKQNVFSPPKINNNEETLFKKKNMPFVKNFRNKNNKQQSVSSKHSKISAKLVTKDKNENNLTKKNDKTQLEHFENTINKGNTSDLRSIFEEADRQLNDKKSMMPREYSKENLLDETDLQISLKQIIPMNQSHQKIQEDERQLNIKLRIKLEDLSSEMNLERNILLEKQTSILTLIKEEKAAQVNIDVILSRDIFTYNNNSILKWERMKYNDEYLSKDKDNIKPIIIDCTCELCQNKNISNRLHNKGFGADNTFIFPNVINEKNTDSYNTDPVVPETADIGIQKSADSNTALNLIDEAQENLINKTEEVTSQSNDPMKNHCNPVSQNQGDAIAVMDNSMISSKTLAYRYVQTDWCNVLLQAKCREDGHYTFHLPDLSLLKKYNII